MNSRQPSSGTVTSRSTLTWLLIFGVIVTLVAPPAGLVTVLLVAVVTSQRPDLRSDRLWTGLVATLIVLTIIVSAITFREIFL